MAKIRDVAHFTHSSPDIASDAQGLWQIVREVAAAQGDERGLNAGHAGVIWRGALNQVMREACSDWPDDYRKDVAIYLDRSGHLYCQSRNARPPVWWVRPEWSDGDLTITQTPPPRSAPSPKPTATAKSAPAATPPPASPASGALAFLRQMDERLAAAEKRAEEAEARAAAAEAKRDATLARAVKAETELKEIDELFKRIGGAK